MAPPKKRKARRPASRDSTSPPRPDRGEQVKAVLAAGGRALARGAQMTATGISRYAAWVERKNAEAIERDERDRVADLERQQRAVERRKAALELSREQRVLEAEERRLQIELMRDEAKFRREFGNQPPPQDPGTSFGAPSSGASPQGFSFGFGTPAPGFQSPAEIIRYDRGLGLDAPQPPGRKRSSR